MPRPGRGSRSSPKTVSRSTASVEAARALAGDDKAG